MGPLEGWGFHPVTAAHFQLLERDDLVAARVVADGRSVFPMAGPEPVLGELAGHLHEAVATGTAPRPVVGDWVAAESPTDGHWRIHHVLDRRTALARRAAGSDARSQVIAANVDVVVVVTAVGRDLNARRLERYLAVAWESGATPLVVLNKVDAADDLAAARAVVDSVARGADVVATSALHGDGVAGVAERLAAGSTAAVIGSSGVGKSTLVNRLLGDDTLATSHVGVTGKGRHTTTRRELHRLPGGGLLIDTPGLRELGIAGGGGVDDAFDDIITLAAGCRYGDCRHVDEPGCAVLAAASDGTLPADRLASYRKLTKEAAAWERRQDPTHAANAKKRWKAMNKTVRARYKVDPKYGGSAD